MGPPTPLPAKRVGDGHPRLPGARRSCILALLLTRHLSPTRPLGPQGSRRGGCEGGEVVTRALQTEKESRKQASNEATPSAPPPFARGGSRLPPEGFPSAWEPAKAPTRATPWRRGSPKDRSCDPSPRTSRSCCSLRLRSGSTSFLRRESARVVCCWGVRGRRFEITWPSGHRPRERERGRWAGFGGSRLQKVEDSPHPPPPAPVLQKRPHPPL